MCVCVCVCVCSVCAHKGLLLVCAPNHAHACVCARCARWWRTQFVLNAPPNTPPHNYTHTHRGRCCSRVRMRVGDGVRDSIVAMTYEGPIVAHQSAHVRIMRAYFRRLGACAPNLNLKPYIPLKPTFHTHNHQHMPTRAWALHTLYTLKTYFTYP